MPQMPYLIDIKIQLNQKLIQSLTNNPQADLYRIISYDAMCSQLEYLCTVTNLFYTLNIVKSEEIYRKAMEIAKIPLTQYYDPHLTELTSQIDKEIQKGNYHKAVYHQIMLLDNISDPFSKLQQAIDLVFDNNKKYIPQDIMYFLDNQYDAWKTAYESIRAVLQSYYDYGCALSDKEIMETLNKLNEEVKNENRKEFN